MLDEDIIPQSQLNTEDSNKANIESEKEVRQRLNEGVAKNRENVNGWQLVGTTDNPVETYARTAPMPEDEIDSVIKDHLLPAAIKASSVEQCLTNAEVTTPGLRDLCSKVEEPTLQVIRDACADLARGKDDEEVEQTEPDDCETDDDETYEDMLQERKRKNIANTPKHKDENKKKKKKKGQKMSRKTKVMICGRTIWNHASEMDMSQDGWFRFSVMAKDCDLKDAVELCRKWSEFSDLSCLTCWQYFPASNWTSWGNDAFVQQLKDLGLYPYFVDLDAARLSRPEQVGGRSRGRRQHNIVEARNILCGHMKRNDPATRRFLQYLVMHAGELLVWREKKSGLGRASKNEWDVLLEVGPEYYDMTDELREWRVGFDDYYDVFIWDFVPGRGSMELYNEIVMNSETPGASPIPATEKDTLRTRMIKPRDAVASLYDNFMDENNEYFLWNVKDHGQAERREISEVADSNFMFYNEINAMKDRILFPEDENSTKKSQPFREIRNGVSRVERGMGGHSQRVAEGLRAVDRDEDPLG